MIFERLKYFFEDLYHKIIIRPIKRISCVWSYAKQGWSTNDWDYEYLLEDIIFKLRRIRKEITKNNILPEEQIKDINFQILVISGLIQRYMNDEYTNEEYFSGVPEQHWKEIWKLMDKYLRNFWD